MKSTEVIHCEDCKHYDGWICSHEQWRDPDGLCPHTDPNDFCSYGEIDGEYIKRKRFGCTSDDMYNALELAVDHFINEHKDKESCMCSGKTDCKMCHIHYFLNGAGIYPEEGVIEYGNK